MVSPSGPAPVRSRLQEWEGLLRASGDAALRAAIVGPVLVEVADLTPPREGRGYFTSAAERVLPVFKSGRELLAGPIREVFPVAKAAGGSAFSTQIAIGRVRSADIVLPYRHVSKLHAVLCEEEGEGGHVVIDAGSTNGTWVDAHRLVPRERRPLASGAVLRLGVSQLVYLSPEEAMELIRGQPSARR